MKKIIFLLIMLSLCFGLASCGNDDASTPSTQTIDFHSLRFEISEEWENWDTDDPNKLLMFTKTTNDHTFNLFIGKLGDIESTDPEFESKLLVFELQQNGRIPTDAEVESVPVIGTEGQLLKYYDDSTDKAYTEELILYTGKEAFSFKLLSAEKDSASSEFMDIINSITLVENALPEKEETGSDDSETTAETPALGESNALSKAHDYLSIMPFSKSGLIDQLEYEGFTNNEATYAAENCGVDWKQQAALKAQDYLDTMSFSREELLDQLEFEGFTSEQAEYGVSAVGY